MAENSRWCISAKFKSTKRCPTCPISSRTLSRTRSRCRDELPHCLRSLSSGSREVILYIRYVWPREDSLNCSPEKDCSTPSFDGSIGVGKLDRAGGCREQTFHDVVHNLLTAGKGMDHEEKSAPLARLTYSSFVQLQLNFSLTGSLLRISTRSFERNQVDKFQTQSSKSSSHYF